MKDPKSHTIFEEPRCLEDAYDEFSRLGDLRERDVISDDFYYEVVQMLDEYIWRAELPEDDCTCNGFNNPNGCDTCTRTLAEINGNELPF